MREFKSGATRDDDIDKLDYDGFLSPLALKRYAEYLHKHRIQADGKMRDSDNWQRGLEVDTYMKSMFRHLVDLWTIHRGHIAEDKDGNVIDIEEALSAVIFNAFGYLHELLIDKGTAALEEADPILVSSGRPCSGKVWGTCIYGYASLGERMCHIKRCASKEKES